MSAAFAAASSSGRFAPSSLGCRKLMMEAKPNFLISGTAVALIAPEQATVVSRRWKLVMPSTFSLVTSCARTGPVSQRPVTKAAAIRNRDFIESLLYGKLHYATKRLEKASFRSATKDHKFVSFGCDGYNNSVCIELVSGPDHDRPGTNRKASLSGASRSRKGDCVPEARDECRDPGALLPGFGDSRPRRFCGR